jgi:hypothetical protein
MTEAAIPHTPGPWEIVPTVHSDRKHIFHLDPGHAYYIGTLISGSQRDLALFKANARLIGTAPELLEALEDLFRRTEAIVDWLNAHPTLGIFHSEVTFTKARAAIAKARGQS